MGLGARVCLILEERLGTSDHWKALPRHVPAHTITAPCHADSLTETSGVLALLFFLFWFIPGHQIPNEFPADQHVMQGKHSLETIWPRNFPVWDKELQHDVQRIRGLSMTPQQCLTPNTNHCSTSTAALGDKPIAAQQNLSTNTATYQSFPTTQANSEGCSVISSLIFNIAFWVEEIIKISVSKYIIRSVLWFRMPKHV